MFVFFPNIVLQTHMEVSQVVTRDPNISLHDQAKPPVLYQDFQKHPYRDSKTIQIRTLLKNKWHIIVYIYTDISYDIVYHSLCYTCITISISYDHMTYATHDITAQLGWGFKMVETRK